MQYFTKTINSFFLNIQNKQAGLYKLKLSCPNPKRGNSDWVLLFKMTLKLTRFIIYTSLNKITCSWWYISTLRVFSFLFLGGEFSTTTSDRYRMSKTITGGRHWIMAGGSDRHWMMTGDRHEW